MRRSTIAVFLLLVPPFSARACYDENKVGWLNETPARSWEIPDASRQGDSWDEMGGLWGIAAGTMSLALFAISFRAYSRARDKNPVPAREAASAPFDRTSDGTIRVDGGHAAAERSRVTREDAGRQDPVTARKL